MTKKENHDHLPAHFNKKEVLSKIMPVIEKIAFELGLILVEVDFVKEGGSWHLRIFIYRHDHGITHEDCEKLTRGMDEYLEQIVSIPFYLEVSSPGLERKLKSPKEYIIFKGKKATVKLRQPLEDGNKIIEVTILDYTEGYGLKLKLENGTEITVKDDNINTVRLKADFDFNVHGNKGE